MADFRFLKPHIGVPEHKQAIALCLFTYKYTVHSSFLKLTQQYISVAAGNYSENLHKNILF